MKRILTLILATSMLALLIVPSFADTTAEEAEILEAAKKGTVLYDIGTGNPDMIYYLYFQENFESKTDIAYTFMRSIIPAFDDFKKYDLGIDNDEGLTPEETDYFLMFWAQNYVKLGNAVTSLEDLQSLTTTYLKGYTAKLNDEKTVEKYPGGYPKTPPLIYEINGEPYISVFALGFDLSNPLIRFEDFEVASINGEKATVNAFVYVENIEKYTIELVKDKDQWKVCGGSLFSDFFVDHGYECYFSPNTGEDFSLATHTVIIAATLSIMLLLTRKRYHKA